MQIEEMTKEIKDYDKFVKEELEEDNFFDEFESNENDNTNILNENSKIILNHLKIFKIYFYFKLNAKNEFIFPIESDSLNINKQYGYELINNIINKINNMPIAINFSLKEYIISLKNSDNNSKEFHTNNFELRFCHKKTLKPNYDKPPFSPNSLLADIQNERISFICKNKLYIMLIEKYVDNKTLKNEKEKNNVKEKKICEEDNLEEEEQYEEEEEGEDDNKKIIIKIQTNDCKYKKSDKCTCISFCSLI